MDRQLLAMLLSMFLTNALGLFVYGGIFAYSFKRRRYFVLRVVGAILAIGGIATGMAFGAHAAFVTGWGVSLEHVEEMRIVANLMALLMSTGALFFAYKEKPSLILFAVVAASASHSIAANLYECITTATNINSVYFTIYNGYEPLSFVLYYAIHISTILVVYFLLARVFAKAGKLFDKKNNSSIIGAFVIYSYIIVAIQGCQVFNNHFNGSNLDALPLMFNGIMIIVDVFFIFCQRFLLVWAKTSQEKEEAERFFESYKKQTEAQLANMELINIKCHDMKHQLRSMLEKQSVDEEFIKEAQDVISVYDSQVKTGNDALDLLLTQKSLACSATKTELTVMIDGEALSFMSAQDINSFFGNAIDNALEYLTRVPEKNRFIRISSKKVGEMMSIRIENYCTNDITFNKSGLPQTTKEDNGYHGFGTKSIQMVARKYSGDASFEREDDLFVMTAYFVV